MRLPLFLLVCVLALPAPPGRAEEDDADVYQGGEIEVRDERLRPVEVFQDTAVETEWITEEAIEAIPSTDAAEVIQNLAGVRTQQRLQGQSAAVSIEGMPSEYTQLLVDGERWSGEIGGVGDAADIPLQNVKRIEVLRGSQGARYGSDAGGGVVNVITHGAPTEGWSVRAKGAGGSHPRGFGGGTGALRLGPLGLSLSGEYDRTYGYDPPSDPDVVFTGVGGEDSVTEEYHGYAKWDAALGETLTARGNALYRVEDVRLVPEDSGETLPRNDTNWRGNLGLDWLARESTQVSTDFTYYAVETDSDVGRSFELFEDEFKNDLTVDHFFSTGPVDHALLVGGQSLVQRLRLDEGQLPPGIENDALAAGRRVDAQFVIPSAYVQTESALTDWFSLVLGARARFHSEFTPRVLPQAAVLLKPHATLKLRAAWGLNSRTPSLRDLYQPPTPQLGGAYFLAGNPDLDPEESMSLRGGFEWSPAKWLSLSSTGFYNEIDDHIRSQFSETIAIGTETRLVDFRDTVAPEDLPALEAICAAQELFFPDPNDWTPECRSLLTGQIVEQTFVRQSNVFRKSNLDSVTTWGLEAQLRLRVTRWAAFAVDYTWLRTRVDDSNIDIDELPNEPEHAVTVRGELVVPRLETRLSAAFRYRTGVIPEGSGTGLLSFADSSDRTDPSHALDLRITQPLGGWLEIWADANNLTDERREDSYAVRGRSFLVGFSGHFAASSF